MEDFIKFNVKEFFTKDDILDYSEKKDPNSNVIKENKGISLLKLWQTRNQFVQPGISENTAIALEFSFTKTNNEEISIKDFNDTVLAFIREFFEQENVLSVMKESDTLFFFVYPLNKRTLDSSRWEHKGKINANLEIRFYELLSEKTKKVITKQSRVLEEKEVIINFPSFEEETSWSPDDIKEKIYETRNGFHQIQTKLPVDRVRDVSEKTLYHFVLGPEKRLYFKILKGEAKQEELLESVNQYLSRFYPDFGEHDKNVVIEKILSAFYGYDIIDELIEDEAISDIKIISWNQIRVKVYGERMTSNLKFMNPEDYNRFVEGICLKLGVDRLRNREIIRRTDKYSSDKCILRINITTPHINSNDSFCIHFRKIPKVKNTISQLIDIGMMDSETALYLKNKAKNGRGMLFIGKGGSGKTTLMNTLIECIPYNSSGLVIQESEELFSNNQPEFVFQHSITDEVDGSGDYGLFTLARNGLLTDVDYYIIGEIKGDEALYFLNAADTGHKCWASVHGPSARDGVDKIADYVMYKGKYNKKEALYMLKQLEVIVFMKKYKVCEICEIVGYDIKEESLIFKKIYERKIL